MLNSKVPVGCGILQGNSESLNLLLPASNQQKICKLQLRIMWACSTVSTVSLFLLSGSSIFRQQIAGNILWIANEYTLQVHNKECIYDWFTYIPVDKKKTLLLWYFDNNKLSHPLAEAGMIKFSYAVFEMFPTCALRFWAWWQLHLSTHALKCLMRMLLQIPQTPTGDTCIVQRELTVNTQPPSLRYAFRTHSVVWYTAVTNTAEPC